MFPTNETNDVSANFAQVLQRIKTLEDELRKLKRIEVPKKSQLGALMSTYLSIPLLRGFVPFSANKAPYAVRDFAADLYHARYGLGIQTWDGLAPCGQAIESGGSNGWSPGSDVSSFKIKGGSGITIGAWVKLDDVSIGENQAIVSKFRVATGGRSYILYEPNNEYIKFRISSDGGYTNVDDVTSTNKIIADEWTFVVGRWYPSDTIDVWVDKTKTSAVSTEVGIYDSVSWLSIMSNYYGPYLTEGYVSMVFIAACKLDDAYIEKLWGVSHTLFGK